MNLNTVVGSGHIDHKTTKAFLQRDREFLYQLRVTIEQEYGSPEFGLARLANNMDFSARQIQRKLKLLSDCTPSEYIRNYRLDKALPYLEQGDFIKEVARKVGFASQSYFTSCFKARYCLTPTEFRQQAKY